MTEFISIGADIGGPEAVLLSNLKVPFIQELRRKLTSTHCSAIDQYEIVLRVDGSLAKFGPEGLARLRFAKSRRYITIDIQVPESVWQSLSHCELKEYLVRQVQLALEACISRLVKEGFEVDHQKLRAEVASASEIYRSTAGDA